MIFFQRFFKFFQGTDIESQAKQQENIQQGDTVANTQPDQVGPAQEGSQQHETRASTPVNQVQEDKILSSRLTVASPITIFEVCAHEKKNFDWVSMVSHEKLGESSILPLCKPNNFCHKPDSGLWFSRIGEIETSDKPQWMPQWWDYITDTGWNVEEYSSKDLLFLKLIPQAPVVQLLKNPSNSMLPQEWSNKYTKPFRGFSLRSDEETRWTDWKLVARDYDGIIFESNAPHNGLSALGFGCNGWDVDSLVLWSLYNTVVSEAILYKNVGCTNDIEGTKSKSVPIYHPIPIKLTIDNANQGRKRSWSTLATLSDVFCKRRR
jgi:hypothetical protein